MDPDANPEIPMTTEAPRSLRESLNALMQKWQADVKKEPENLANEVTETYRQIGKEPTVSGKIKAAIDAVGFHTWATLAADTHIIKDGVRSAFKQLSKQKFTK